MKLKSNDKYLIKKNFETEINCINNLQKASFNWQPFYSASYELIRCPVKSKNNEILGYHYYIIDKQLIGEGASGRVYCAYPIDPKTFKADLTKKFAAKIFNDKSKYDEKEVEILRRYHRTESPIVERNRIILITEFLNGKVLIDHGDDDKPHSDLSKLTFNQRVNTIVQLLLNTNLLHHNTQRTGCAVIHGDLKANNVLLDVDKKTSHTEVSICDHGFSEDTEDDPFLLITATRRGSPGYFPPELIRDKKHGIKSDIYSLVPIIIYIFGGKYPFTNKNSIQQEIKNISLKLDNSYDFEGIFTDFPIPPYAKKILFPIIDFLDRMQSDSYQVRPDSDEVLRFFTTLNNYCKACEKKSDADTIAILNAKLILLASGSWQHIIGSKEIDKDPNTPDEMTSIIVPTSYEQYNFDEYPIISKAIVALQHKDSDKEKVFSPEVAYNLYSKQDVLRATIIVAFDEIGSLNATNLKRITTGYSRKQLNAIMNLYQHQLLTQDSLQLVDSNSFAQKVNQLSEESWKKLTQLIKIGKVYGLTIDLHALKDIICDKGEISAPEILKATLQAYKIHRTNDKRGNYFHFWSRLTGYDGKTKCQAVDEKIASLNDPNETISSLSQKALHDGRLKKILHAFQPYMEAEQASNIVNLP